MLERIREGSQGVTAKIILGLVILTFALAGVGSYINSTPPPPVAVVNGEEISQSSFDQKYQASRSRMEQQFGEMFQNLFDDQNYVQNFQKSVLEQLVAEVLQSQLADETGMFIGDEALKGAVLQMPEFQVDGQFDNQTYQMVLKRAGYQPKDFFNFLRIENTRRQLAQAVINTEFSLSTEVNNYTKLDKQTRDIEYVLFKQDEFKPQVTISEEEQTRYYEANLANYETQEKIALQFVELKITDLMQNVDVSEQQLQQYYQDNIVDYRTSVARRQAAHILVEFGDDEAVALAKAEGILAELKSGADFSEVVKTKSEDLFTADTGGMLDWMMIGSEGVLEEAVFALTEVNQITDVVRSEEGFHILKLINDEQEEIKDFTEVKQEIADTLKREAVLDLYDEQVESLRDNSYEVPDTLQTAADAIDATLQETALFTRMNPPPVVNFPQVMNQAFGDQVMIERYNSEMIEVGDGHVMVVRLLNHQPVRTKTQQEVAQQIELALTNDKAQQLAEESAQALLTQLSGDVKLANDPQASELTVVSHDAVSRNATDLDYGMRGEIFKMPHPEDGKVTMQIIKMSNGDQALVALSGVNHGESSEDNQATEQQLVAQRSQLLYQSFIEGLKEQAEIETFSPQPSRQY